jgi:uncharacterized protein
MSEELLRLAPSPKVRKIRRSEDRLDMTIVATDSATPAHKSNSAGQLTGQLRQWMSSVSSALIAYSGGVDSAVVMAIAHQSLGDRALACIGVSPSYPRRELTAAIAVAEKLGAHHRLVETHEHLDPNYAANPHNRCYFCKNELYGRLQRIAAEESFEMILDGTNASDLSGHRPGHAAAKERGVRSPLAELGFTKQDVRDIAHQLGLPVWNKPASPCLASRVPTGVAVVPDLLRRIERAEDVLVGLGFNDFRVRHHGDVARVELPADNMQRALDRRDQIVEGIRAVGYRFVCLDLAAFKSGSLVPRVSNP